MMKPKNTETQQMAEWSGTFGRDYTDRNALSYDDFEQLYVKNFGLSRTALNQKFLNGIPVSTRILEVGSNVGNQLLCLQNMGFKNLYGIELQDYAVELSKRRTEHINIIQGSAFDIPFKDHYFDLVFTSGVLIHISPQHISEVLQEIFRVAKTYIWGFEYWAPQYEEVHYRGKGNLLWKTNYAELYVNSFEDLELVKEERLKYLTDGNIDSMFLLKKKNG